VTLLAAPPLGVTAADQPAVGERSVSEAVSAVGADEVAEVARDVVDHVAGPAEEFALLAGDRALLGRVLFARHLNASFLERRLLLDATDQPDQNHNRKDGTHPASVPPDRSDPVNHPRHYSFAIEVIDALEAWDLPWHLCNAIKYMVRAGRKDPAKLIEDLEKARWYLDRYIALVKRRQVAK